MSTFKVERDEDGENKSIQEVEEKLLQEKEELDIILVLHKLIIHSSS